MYEKKRIVYKKGNMLDDAQKTKKMYLQRSEFKKQIKKYLTKEEYKKYKDTLVTKTEFQQDMFTGFTAMMVEMAQMRNDFQISFSTLIQEIRSIRQEMVGKLDDHEDRITIIEKKLPPTKKLST